MVDIVSASYKDGSHRLRPRPVRSRSRGHLSTLTLVLEPAHQVPNPMVASVERLRKALMDALSRDPVDFGRVATLSQRLVAYDPETVRFSVDASHISRLGLELVAKQETALAELVKNAYDADATLVTLTLDAANRPGGTLTIVDDGNGMTRDELVAGFMRLSSQIKIAEPQSPRFGRRRAGRKGIGRFATQRLGTRLTVITRTVDAPVSLRLH
jgi:hypothetical protein